MAAKENPSTTRKRLGRLRKGSLGSGDLVIEELSPDDIGYDADVEVLRPSRYEEAGSESDVEWTPSKRSYSLDEELADRMKRLGRERSLSCRSGRVSNERGRKRLSCEVDDEDTKTLDEGLSPTRSLEVQEMMPDISDRPSPAKRRRRKSRRSDLNLQILHRQVAMSTDHIESADNLHRAQSVHSTSPATASDVAIATSVNDENPTDRMDMS